jgi:hypothetical protein
MDEFERAFSRLPWRQASQGLKGRILGERPPRTGWRIFFDRRIAVGWAAGVALAAGALGYALGLLGESGRSAPSVMARTSVELRIIETSSRSNFFDLTGSAGDILPGELTLNVQDSEETEG